MSEINLYRPEYFECIICGDEVDENFICEHEKCFECCKCRVKKETKK